MRTDLTERNSNIAKEYTQGLTIKELARKHGLSVAGIHKILVKKTHTKMRPKGFKADSLIKERDNSITKEYKEGLSLRELGKKYNISKQRVHQILTKRSDVTFRPKGLNKRFYA